MLFRLLGKDPQAVVVSFLSGPEPLALAMLDEIRRLVPDREHFAVTDSCIAGVHCIPPSELPGALRHKRIGLAPVLFTPDPAWRSLRRRAFRMAPTKVLAYNARLERHHLRLRTWIASLLFLRGVPLDRIWLRPKWLLPFKHDRSTWPDRHEVIDGRSLTEGRRRVAILSPYFPYPLSHGGAVRIYNLLREAAIDFDVFLFSFAESLNAAEGTPILNFCSKLILFPNPRYREPRWASWNPPEVNEFRSRYVRKVIAGFRRKYDLRLLQVEYTQLASFGGDVLVEHDVTFDLYEQIHGKQPGFSSWWDLWRWRRYERKAIRKYPRVVVMSDKDANLAGSSNVRIIPNGVDLHRFRPEPDPHNRELLFVGSFRHFPNVAACRFFLNEVWPLLRVACPGIRFTIIAGPDPDHYWRVPEQDPRVAVHGFISDVRPFYASASLVVVPTQVSAGTNLKVLEALAMERAVVSTTSGCAGLGLRHLENVWIADTATDFAEGVATLLYDDELRQRIAREGRGHAEACFDWSRLGVLQRRMWNELLTGNRFLVRPARQTDVDEISRIQRECHAASQWDPETYFGFDVQVAESGTEISGFIVSRRVGEQEIEVLNLAVSSRFRRQGVATTLLANLPAADVFLEVRESNIPAKNLYSKLGFHVVGHREAYYDDPVESALVMRLSRRAEHANF
jgi:ribosomal protein S18 acetylase RimI-like enzyme